MQWPDIPNEVNHMTFNCLAVWHSCAHKISCIQFD